MAPGGSGVLVATTDGGLTWTPQRSATANRLNAIYFLDAQTGWAVGNRGTIRHTRDGGNTWQAQSSPVSFDLLDCAFPNDSTGWIIGRQGTVLHTTDAGKTWIPLVSPVTSDLHAMAFISAETGYLVGARGVILKSGPGTGVEHAVPAVRPPARLQLWQNYPNPFNPATTIRYELPRQMPVSVGIYDIRGREVKRLFKGLQAAGRYSLAWDGTNDRGYAVESGVYVVVLRGPNGILLSKKVLLLK